MLIKEKVKFEVWEQQKKANISLVNMSSCQEAKAFPIEEVLNFP